MLSGEREVRCRVARERAWRGRANVHGSRHAVPRGRPQRHSEGGIMQYSDDQIRHEVEEELRYDPSLAEDDIAVTVRDGVVTLVGRVKSYLDKWRAERSASRVRGVRAIANDLDVRLPSTSTRPDTDIARAAA